MHLSLSAAALEEKASAAGTGTSEATKKNFTTLSTQPSQKQCSVDQHISVVANQGPTQYCCGKVPHASYLVKTMAIMQIKQIVHSDFEWFQLSAPPAGLEHRRSRGAFVNCRFYLLCLASLLCLQHIGCACICFYMLQHVLIACITILFCALFRLVFALLNQHCLQCMQLFSPTEVQSAVTAFGTCGSLYIKNKKTQNTCLILI